MDIQQLHHDGVSVSEIASWLEMDRKTVPKYLRQAPRAYERKVKSWKVDPFRAYLQEGWELGVHNAARLFVEIQKRGCSSGGTQVRAALAPWGSEGREWAFVRFETAPGERAQMDWGHFGNEAQAAVRICTDAELVADAVCGVHPAPGCRDAVELHGPWARVLRRSYGDGLTDNMKTVVLDRVDGRVFTRRCWTSPATTGSCRASAIPTGRRPRARSSRRSATSSRASGRGSSSIRSTI